jgi:hypothetical protein
MEARLAEWQPIALLLQSYLDQWTALLSKAPLGILLVAGVFPIAIVAFSRHLILILGCALLAVLAVCAILAPSYIGVMLATAFYLGSLMIALAGIVARRRSGAVEAELAQLRGDVNRLLEAEEKQYLTKLKEPQLQR